MTEYPPPGQYPSPPPGGDPARPQGGYPPPPSNNYPAPPGELYRPPGQGRGLAITAVVLGVLAIVSCLTVLGGVLLGFLGVIFGIIAVVKARRGTAAGGTLAWVGLVLSALGLIGGIVVGIVAGSWIAGHGGRDYMDCVRQANNDQAKVQQCTDQFRSSLENTPTPAR